MGSDVRIDLISGFRGSGKTTLLGQMASRLWPDERVVLLQNEQGRVRLSRESLPENCFLEEWRGGCLCCTAAAMLGPLLLELSEKYRPSRVVLELAETSRIADVKAAFEAAGNGCFQIEHIIYVLRADTFDWKWELSGEFVARQLSESPAVWLTHTGNVEDALRSRISETISASNPRCAVICPEYGIAELYCKSRIYKKIKLH